jgi:CRISPR/Cas system CMR-associated protein Cmr3 (group 5 of RAMP superfamily)
MCRWCMVTGTCRRDHTFSQGVKFVRFGSDGGLGLFPDEERRDRFVSGKEGMCCGGVLKRG